jgi:hypothetical protein
MQAKTERPLSDPDTQSTLLPPIERPKGQCGREKITPSTRRPNALYSETTDSNWLPRACASACCESALVEGLFSGHFRVTLLPGRCRSFSKVDRLATTSRMCSLGRRLSIDHKAPFRA